MDPVTDRLAHSVVTSGPLVTVGPHWLAVDKLVFAKTLGPQLNA